MNWGSWMLWGFVATLALTTIAAVLQGLGMTRMNIPYLLGTMFTPDRDKAKLYGFLMHVVAGFTFSLLYVVIFEAIGAAGWWRGAIVGVLHGTFVLVVVMTILPGLHPRMASEQHGPEAANQLEPPGFLGLHYGSRTPVSVLLSHTLFGAILGAFYHLR
jgi:hypothetical protein